MEITNRDDLRVGDIATFTHHGHEFTGPLWSEHGALVIGSAVVRYNDGEWYDKCKFIRATREAPVLPTEPGSVILVTECRGERVDEPVLAVLSNAGRWWTHGREFDGYACHHPERIIAWTPAKVVPA